jgi:hypothetical protein
MISMHNNSISKENDDFSRLLYSDSRCSLICCQWSQTCRESYKTCCQCSQTFRRCSLTCYQFSQPCRWCCQTYRQCFQTCPWYFQTGRRCFQTGRWCFRVVPGLCPVNPKFSPLLRGIPKPITITPMVLLNLVSEIPGAMKPVRNAL